MDVQRESAFPEILCLLSSRGIPTTCGSTAVGGWQTALVLLELPLQRLEQEEEHLQGLGGGSPAQVPWGWGGNVCG